MTTQNLKDDYLRKLSWAMAAIPDDCRTEIVVETRTHIDERLEAGSELSEILSSLGDPVVYAERFLDEYEVTAAIGKSDTTGLVAIVFDRFFSNWWVALSTLVCLTLWSLTLVVGVVAILKIFNASTVGLWQGDGFFIFGIIDSPESGKELLGLWLYPIVVVAVSISWFCTRRLSLFALRKYLKHRNQPFQKIKEEKQ